MTAAGARLAVLATILPTLALLAPGAARAGEELSDRGRKVQAAELDGPALAGRKAARGRQQRRRPALLEARAPGNVDDASRVC